MSDSFYVAVVGGGPAGVTAAPRAPTARLARDGGTVAERFGRRLRDEGGFV